MKISGEMTITTGAGTMTFLGEFFLTKRGMVHIMETHDVNFHKTLEGVYLPMHRVQKIDTNKEIDD